MFIFILKQKIKKSKYQPFALAELGQVSLPSKLSMFTAPEFGWDAMVGGDPKAHQEIKGDLHNKASSNNPHTWIGTPTEWWLATN